MFAFDLGYVEEVRRRTYPGLRDGTTLWFFVVLELVSALRRGAGEATLQQGRRKTCPSRLDYTKPHIGDVYSLGTNFLGGAYES